METDRFRVHPGHRLDLSDHPTKVGGMSKKEGKELSAQLEDRLRDLQEMLYAQSTHRLLIVAQAMDTGGKDGLIKRLLSAANPQGVRIPSFKAPTEIELSHDFLWRVHAQVPGNGELVIFNRSHYEDVLVARVHELVPEHRWKARYDHIRHFERLLTDEGTTIVKLFLHISKDEQKKRLEARLADPTKHWKFQSADLAERARWDDYQIAYEDALAETTAHHAPWYVIPADRKWYRDLVVAHIVVDTLERLDLAYPESEDLSGITVH